MNKQIVFTEKMIFGGDCIAKIDGKTVFIPYALPGEKLLIQITDSKRDYDRAEIVEILEASPNRTEPVCPLYKKCGGCNLMHCKNDEQRNLKTKILRDCFLRAGIAEEDIPDIQVIYDRDLGYRARFQFTDGGLLERGSKNIIQISLCPVAEDKINNWLSSTPIDERPRGRVHVFSSEYSDGDIAISSGEENYTDKYKAADFTKANNSTPRGKKSLQKKAKKPRQFFSGTVINEENTVKIFLHGKEIVFDVRGFFQSNIFVLEKALDEICNLGNAERILDMYSGCGVFSAFSASPHVTLVEHNRDALVFAERNLTGVPHESYGISGAVWAKHNDIEKFDGVIIDPPRSGMEKEVRDALKRSSVKQINAVSCNPSTHARDIAELIKNGYKMEKLFLLDFYPQTSHVESLAILRREN